VPTSVDDLGTSWSEVRFEEPALPLPGWLRPIATAVVLALAVVLGEADVLLPAVLAVVAVVSAVLGDWWVALVFALLTPLSIPIVRETEQAVMVRVDGIKVVQALRTTRFDWATVAFGTEPAEPVAGEPRVRLVVTDGERTVRFRGYGAFLQRNAELPAVAERLNEIARQVRALR